MFPHNYNRNSVTQNRVVPLVKSYDDGKQDFVIPIRQMLQSDWSITIQHKVMLDSDAKSDNQSSFVVRNAAFLLVQCNVCFQTSY